MSKTFRFVSMTACALILSAGLLAQERRQGGSDNGLPPYKVANEVTVSGRVANMGSSPTMSGQDFAMVTVTVDGGPLHVLLGPMGFVKKQSFAFAEGAAVQVTGMPGLKFEGEPAMMARQVKIGTRTLTLRDATGKPSWDASVQR